MQILDSLWSRCDRYRFLLVKSDRSADHADFEHLAMADLLALRDGVGLRKLIHSHIDHSYRQLAELVREFTQAKPNAHE